MINPRKQTAALEEVSALSGDYNTCPASFDCDLNGVIVRCEGTQDLVNRAEFTPFIGRVSLVMNP